MLIGLAALAGFTLTMGGWKPVSPSYVAGITFVSSETQFGLYRGGVGPAGALAAFVVLRRWH
jgi:hypothetical protein